MTYSKQRHMSARSARIRSMREKPSPVPRWGKGGGTVIDASTVPALRAWLAACPVSAGDFAELAVDQPTRGVLLGVARVSEQGGALLAAVRTSAVGTLNNNRPTELRLDPTAVDVQLALRTTPGAAKRVLAESGTLVARFPATLAALYAGDIS